MWFRADQRVADNPALHHACRDATRGVVALFIICPEQWREHDWADVKVDFLLRNLDELSARLDTLNIALLIRETSTFDDVPALIANVMKEHECDVLFFNREYEVNERRRDDEVVARCETDGRIVRCFTDQVIIPPGDVLTNDDSYYTVFTPFRKACYNHLGEQGVPKPLGRPKKQQDLITSSDDVPKTVRNFESATTAQRDLWPAGEKEAKRRLSQFAKKRIKRYKDDRDHAAIDGTSRISPWLAVGAISPRLCLQKALEANRGKLESGSKSVDAWISEVFWREFFRHVLVGFPRVSKHRAFREDVDHMVDWRYDDEQFQAWCDGRTGFPIVDAAMRQLNETGWMHNRLRMIVAMFLTKDLLIDWRRGERYFMRRLIDGDLASNNGGWQWSASTGADAAPYFRIYNPWTQSSRFDPDGGFIREFLPELRDVDSKALHDPAGIPSLERARLDYPEPIVNHAEARKRALAAYRRDE